MDRQLVTVAQLMLNQLKIELKVDAIEHVGWNLLIKFLLSVYES